MRAMILAAGRGERMRPLTDTVPKPLLPVAGKPLIVWHIERLVAAGIRDIVINHAWLGDQIESQLGDGSRYGARIRFSPEGSPLETAGGIATALPLLGVEPFLVLNADIWCDWDPALAPGLAANLALRGALAWILLVRNPDHHPEGDFALDSAGLVHDRGPVCHTFSGIGIYDPGLFAGCRPGQPARLAPVLRDAMREHRVCGALHSSCWVDVGTVGRLAQLDALLRHASIDPPPIGGMT